MFLRPGCIKEQFRLRTTNAWAEVHTEISEGVFQWWKMSADSSAAVELQGSLEVKAVSLKQTESRLQLTFPDIAAQVLEFEAASAAQARRWAKTFCNHQVYKDEFQAV